MPRGTMVVVRTAGWMLAVVVSGAAGDESRPNWCDPSVELPVSQSAVELSAAEFVTVNLTRDGEVRAGGKVMSLDGLATWVHAQRRLYDERLGRRPRNEPAGAEQPLMVTELAVRLRVDKDAAWLHVIYVLTVLAEQKFHRVYWAARPRASRAYSDDEAERLGAVRSKTDPPELAVKWYLPVDEMPDPSREPPAELLVNVRAEALDLVVEERGAEDARFKVETPSRVVYKLNELESEDLMRVERWIADGQKYVRDNPGSVAVGEIKAPHHMPFKFVVALHDRYLRHRYEKMQFYGAPMPATAVRKLPRLPFPEPDDDR